MSISNVTWGAVIGLVAAAIRRTGQAWAPASLSTDPGLLDIGAGGDVPGAGTSKRIVAPVPRLWTAFVLGWLPAFGIVAWGLVQEPLAPLRLVAVLLALAALVALYLGLTLRGALADADLTSGGPWCAGDCCCWRR